MTTTIKKNEFTKRDMFEAIIAAFTGAEVPADKAMPEAADIVDFCNKQIANLETARAGAKRRADAKKAEPDALRDAVFAVVAAATEPMTSTEVVLALNDEEATMGKVSNRLTTLVNDGHLYKANATIKDDSGKAAKRMVYSVDPFEA